MKRFRNGTRIEKSEYCVHDAHREGAKGIVTSSIGPIPFEGEPEVYGYMVIWDDMPELEVFVAGTRIREIKAEA